MDAPTHTLNLTPARHVPDGMPLPGPQASGMDYTWRTRVCPQWTAVRGCQGVPAGAGARVLRPGVSVLGQEGTPQLHRCTGDSAPGGQQVVRLGHRAGGDCGRDWARRLQPHRSPGDLAGLAATRGARGPAVMIPVLCAEEQPAWEGLLGRDHPCGSGGTLRVTVEPDSTEEKEAAAPVAGSTDPSCGVSPLGRAARVPWRLRQRTTATPCSSTHWRRDLSLLCATWVPWVPWVTAGLCPPRPAPRLCPQKGGWPSDCTSVSRPLRLERGKARVAICMCLWNCSWPDPKLAALPLSASSAVAQWEGGPVSSPCQATGCHGHGNGQRDSGQHLPPALVMALPYASSGDHEANCTREEDHFYASKCCLHGEEGTRGPSGPWSPGHVSTATPTWGQHCHTWGWRSPHVRQRPL